MSFGKSKNNQSGSQNQQFSGVDNYNTNTNFNQTSTPTNAPWVDATAQVLNSGLNGLTGLDPHSFVAAADPLQTQAASGADTLGANDAQPFGAARDATGYIVNASAPHTNGVQASGYIQQYMDPFQNDVINAADADLTHNEGLTRATDDLALAGSGAFGGSGAALTKAADTEALARTRASTLSGIRSQGYAQALSAAQQDAQRQQGAKDLNAQLYGQQMDRSLGAARQLGDLTTAQDTNQRSNITTQEQLGEALRGIQQQYAQSPIDYQNALNSLFASLPTSLFHGETQAGTQDETGTDNQSGTSSGTSTGNSTGLTFGLKAGGK